MNNYTKINTKNHPEFLELGDDYNDPIILMKGLERVERGIDGIRGMMFIQILIMLGILVILIL